MRAALVAVFVLLPVVFAVSPALAASFTVTASNFQWTPADLSIAPGDSVTYTNGGGSHNWVMDDESDSCSLPCTRTYPVEGIFAYHCGVHPSMMGVVRVGTGPVVAITTPAAGATVGGLVRIEGTAVHASLEIQEVAVSFDARAPTLATIVGTGESVSWTIDLPTAGLTNGAHTITARAHAGGPFGTATLDVLVDNPPALDVGVVSLSAGQAATTTNTITFGVTNFGNVPSGIVPVLVEYQYQGSWHAVGTQNLASIPAGSTRSGSVVWDPAGVAVGRFPIRATADPGAILPDADRTNNVRAGSAAWVTGSVGGVIAP